MKRVPAVPHDGRNAKLALGEVARHVGSGGAEFADEHDGRRKVTCNLDTYHVYFLEGVHSLVMPEGMIFLENF